MHHRSGCIGEYSCCSDARYHYLLGRVLRLPGLFTTILSMFSVVLCYCVSHWVPRNLTDTQTVLNAPATSTTPYSTHRRRLGYAAGSYSASCAPDAKLSTSLLEFANQLSRSRT